MIIPKSSTAICSLLALIGFILIVVATCSTPVNEDIYLFELRRISSNETTIARVGLLGVCGDHFGRTSTGRLKALHHCTKEELGFPITTSKKVQLDDGRTVRVESTVVNQELTRALVFNPLAATFSGLVVILGFLTYAIEDCLCLSVWTYLLLSVSTCFAWIAFAINISIVLRSKARVNDFAVRPDQIMSLKIGPTSWISLAGAIALLFAFLIWTTQVIRIRARLPTSPRIRSPKVTEGGPPGSIYSMGYSTPSTSRRTSRY